MYVDLSSFINCLTFYIGALDRVSATLISRLVLKLHDPNLSTSSAPQTLVETTTFQFASTVSMHDTSQECDEPDFDWREMDTHRPSGTMET